MKRILLTAIGLLTAAALFAGGQQGGAGAASSPGTAASAGATLTIMHDKVAAPDFQPFFMAASAESSAAIGVKLEPVGYPSTDVYTANIRSVLPTQAAPDLFTWWAGAWITDLQKSGLLEPITPIWDKYKAEFSQGIRDAFTIDGQLYALPWALEYWTVFYNKDVFRQLGIAEPATWNDLIAACDKIKAAGITPLNQTIVGEWPAFITFEEIACSNDYKLFNDLCAGRAKWTDPKVIAIFEEWKGMMDRGYFTDPSTDFFGDMPRLFNDNKLAMICAGTWYYQANLLNNGIPAEKVGFFFIPAKDGSNRAILEPSPILIPKNAPHKDATLKAVDYFMSAKGNTFLAKHSGGFPVNSKSDASYLTAFQKSIQDKVNGGNFNLPVRFWENMPTELMLQVNGKFQEFIVRQTAPATICADIQKLCDAYFNK